MILLCLLTTAPLSDLTAVFDTADHILLLSQGNRYTDNHDPLLSGFPLICPIEAVMVDDFASSSASLLRGATRFHSWPYSFLSCHQSGQ